MKTLTITEAKKNLGKWLTAAGRGEDVGIISGAQIIGLKPIEVIPKPPLDIRELTYEYAHKEYGVTKKEFERFEARLDAEYEISKREGTLLTIHEPTLENLEKALNSRAKIQKAVPKTPRRTARAGARRAA